MKDHPCVCREKPIEFTIKGADIGSPLRVQGKDIQPKTHMVTTRITPACAGKRIQDISLELRTKDHPCVCREK